jgi:HlyD family secretion protein
MLSFPQEKPRDIFRKVALDRLSSPDELDILMQVTSPKGWIALLTLCGAVLVALAWGIFGSIPTKVDGKCIFTRAGGVYEVSTGAQGRVVELRVNVGDVVKKGELIARIANPQLELGLEATRNRLVELNTRKATLRSYAERGQDLQEGLLKSQRANLESRIATGNSRIKNLQEKIQSQEQLLAQGLITRQTLLATRLELESVRQDNANARSEIQQLSLRGLEAKKQVDAELAQVNLEINETQRKLASDQQNLTMSTEINSPYDGRVLEIKAGLVGTLVGTGASLITLERVGNDIDNPLEAIVFVSALEGKNVKLDMNVQITPTNVKREEVGFMVGQVKWISEFPSSAQGMMRILQNDKLVEQLSSGGAPIRLQAALLRDPSTATGYKWSSGNGPEHKIESGTLCAAQIVTDRKRPITLVVPALKKWLGVA